MPIGMRSSSTMRVIVMERDQGSDEEEDERKDMGDLVVRLASAS